MNKLLIGIMLSLLVYFTNLACAEEVYQVELSASEKEWLVQHPVLKIGVMIDAYPYEFLDDKGNYRGLSSDYANLLANTLDVQFEVVPVKNWKAAAELFKNKQIDIFPLMVKKDMYDLGLIFSDTYMASSLGIFSFGNATFINNLDDVLDQKIAIERETIEQTPLLENKQENFIIYDTALQAMEAANNGKADFYIGDILNAKYLIDKKGLKNLHYVAPVVGSAFDFAIATSKDNPEFISATNKTLRQVLPVIHSDIRQKWSTQNYGQQELIRNFVKYVISLLILFMVVLIYLMYRNQRMRKQALRLSQMQKMESIGRMAGGIAHDFNNMLAGILGASESLSARLEANSPLLKYTDIIGQASERLASLTSELLVFAREKDKAYVVLELNNIVEKAVRLLGSGLQKQYCVNLELAAEKSYVFGSQDLIESMILNLAVNARDAMHKGGCVNISTREIELDANNQEEFLLPFKSGEYIELEVSDEGSGISPEIAGKIFEPFFTTKEVGKGTGLGLAAVYGVVRDHHGTMRYKTSTNGTSFFVYLPLVEKVEVASVEVQSKDKLQATILVVDDEKILLELLSDILASMGAKVITCAEALQVQDIYQQNPDIDIVMLDVIMPHKNGVDIYQELRMQNPYLKMVLMSGYSQDKQIEQIVEEDKYVVFMGKPYKIETCRQVLQKLLRII